MKSEKLQKRCLDSSSLPDNASPATMQYCQLQRNMLKVKEVYIESKEIL